MKEIHTIDDLKDVLEQAALTDKSLPATAVLGAKSTWPDFLREPRELSVLLNDEPLFTPTKEDIADWEVVCLEWINFFTEAEKRKEWAVIWLKACKAPSKVIEKKTGMCRTKVWYSYERGLRKLFECLTHRALPQPKKIKKKRIVGFTKDLRTLKEAIYQLEQKLKRKNIK